MIRRCIVSFIVASSLTGAALAQPKGFNYDEANVPKFELPKLLVAKDGSAVTSAQAWRESRRGEVLALFETHMFGKSPKARKIIVKQLEQDRSALGGKAIRKQVQISFSDKPDGPRMELLLYLPMTSDKGPSPLFLGLNFHGNHTVHADPAIRLTDSWVRKSGHSAANKATAKGRGASASRWQVEKIIGRGYGLGVIYYGEIDQDYHDGFHNCVHPLYYRDGQEKPEADEWGSIAAWAWGLSRAVDYLETDADVDAKQIAVLGHSRLGKTSLWAGAQDERFAIVISNDSGCGGAALSRRRFGETVKRINDSFPHWFNDNFVKYNGNEDALPLDQHMLIALSAPRPVYVASAKEDRWADPRGEFLSIFHAAKVYKLLGVGGLGTDKMPQVDRPVSDHLGYHIRSGKHDVTAFDWEQYLKFADKHGMRNRQR